MATMFMVIAPMLIARSAAFPLSQSRPAILPRDEKHPTWGCPFPGNSDLYGLGIRLGVYLQLLSTILANYLRKPSIRKDSRNTNAIIMVAVFAAMLTSTIQKNLNSVEIFIMSTVLGAFLWSDFTPLHISSIVLFDRLEEHGNDWKSKCYAHAIARSVFGTAKAVYDVWFWLHGRHVLLKNDIVDPTGKCQPTIFLHTQIILNGYQPTFYIIVAIFYAMFETVFFAWWLVILTPGTVKLIIDVASTIFMAIIKLEFSRIRQIKKMLAIWYYGFGKLDSSRLAMWDRVRMSNTTRERLTSLRNFCTWFGPFGLPAGYTVIIWSALAIELTLAWNEVSGVYVLGSTGQLIPFVVGVLGMLRSIHFLFMEISEKISRGKERGIEVEWEDGRFLYTSKSGVELELKASRPERRRSVDCSSLESAGSSFASLAEESLRSLTWR